MNASLQNFNDGFGLIFNFKRVDGIGSSRTPIERESVRLIH